MRFADDIFAKSGLSCTLFQLFVAYNKKIVLVNYIARLLIWKLVVHLFVNRMYLFDCIMT